MIFDIVQAGDPVLRTPAQPVDVSVIGTPEFDRLIANMVETMHDAPGVGLAAPQIGLPLQLIVLQDTADDDEDADDPRMRSTVPLTVLINPNIEFPDDEMVTFYEGCLSVSGWAAMTPRHVRARVHALNQKGEEITLDWKGWPARILQHEIDHLNGTLYVDHMETRTFATTESLTGD